MNKILNNVNFHEEILTTSEAICLGDLRECLFLALIQSRSLKLKHFSQLSYI